MNENRVKSGLVDRKPPEKEPRPTHVQAPEGNTRPPSILLFVPRNPVSALINHLTGNYGYSHLAVDCGEIDTDTGNPVMIEATPALGVHYGLQDEYDERKFVRIPLEKAGIDPDTFCDCIHSKLGEKYGYEEALTLGILKDPARQICSDLATVCLPETVVADITKGHLLGVIHPLAVAHIHKSEKSIQVFVSPNGFAEYLGAPKGNKLSQPDQLWEPVLPGRKRPLRQVVTQILKRYPDDSSASLLNITLATAFRIFLRTVAIYLSILVLLRLSGKREIGQMTIFNLVVMNKNKPPVLFHK